LVRIISRMCNIWLLNIDILHISKIPVLNNSCLVITWSWQLFDVIFKLPYMFYFLCRSWLVCVLFRLCFSCSTFIKMPYKLILPDGQLLDSTIVANHTFTNILKVSYLMGVSQKWHSLHG
jgi:hypothetical protein